MERFWGEMWGDDSLEGVVENAAAVMSVRARDVAPILTPLVRTQHPSGTLRASKDAGSHP